METTNNLFQRRSIKLNCSEPQLTDQKWKKSCDINNIMKQYAKTGLLPQFMSKTPRFVDNTAIPDLITASEAVNRAYELFYELPSAVRKAMGNDHSQLENFIADEANHDFLRKHGVLAPVKTQLKEAQASEIKKESTKKVEEK